MIDCAEDVLVTNVKQRSSGGKLELEAPHIIHLRRLPACGQYQCIEEYRRAGHRNAQFSSWPNGQTPNCCKNPREGHGEDRHQFSDCFGTTFLSRLSWNLTFKLKKENEI